MPCGDQRHSPERVATTNPVNKVSHNGFFMPRSQEYVHLYQTRQWKALRKRQLEREPLCCYCKAMNRIVPANVVNHKQAHKGDWNLFCDPENLESVCQPHHDNLIRRQERSGAFIGSDNGRPRDPLHPWNLRPAK